MSEFSPKEEKTVSDRTGSEEKLYHWNYSEQLAYDRASEVKQRRRGGAIYALIMASAFLVCIFILVGVLIWYQATAPSAGTDGSSANITAVAEAVNPATVLIYAQDAYGTGYGTGFFLRDDGYIATNYHVVEGADRITVRLYSGKELEATLIGGSAPDDLAVIKVKGAGYPIVQIGNSDALKVGDTAIALGHPAGEEGAWSTTSGIISATNRFVSVNGSGYSAEVKMLQTDAPLNNGNSGGPLCNAKGEVIGVVSRKLSNTEGIGFAIPINEAIRSLSAMIDGNYNQLNSTVAKVRPSIGITASDISAGTVLRYEDKTYTVPYNGVYVNSIVGGSGADGKLSVGDVIYAMNGKGIANMADLQEILYSHNVGDTVTLSIDRLGTKLEVKIKLGIVEQ